MGKIGNSEARLEALREMFYEAPVNEPRTPIRSLTGEVREKTIWGYWAQGYDQMPDFFKLCVGTWQRLNPHWDVRILDKSTIHEYLSEVELPNRFMQMFSHQTASDAVRLGLLSRYGGVWLDVNIILRTNLDSFCWNAIKTGKHSAAIFFHPLYGTQALGGEDFVESWFMASQAGNPFFIQWRDTFRELFHNRLDTEGLLEHPLYQGVDLEGFERLNRQFSGSTMDFRTYLAIHAMCHRLIETIPQAREMWRDNFLRIDAANTAFRMQLDADRSGLSTPEVLLSQDPRADELVEGIPLIKFTTPHYGPLLFLQRSHLEDRSTLLGRLLDAMPPVSTNVSTSPASTSRSGQRSRMQSPLPTRAFSSTAGNKTFCSLAKTRCHRSLVRPFIGLALLASAASAAARASTVLKVSRIEGCQVPVQHFHPLAQKIASLPRKGTFVALLGATFGRLG